MTWGRLATAVSVAAPARAAALAASPTSAPPSRSAAPADRLAALLTSAQLATVTRAVAMGVPAVRAAHATVTKRPATWHLRAWRGDYLAPSQPAWLANPDPRCTWYTLCAQTLADAVWGDRAWWRVTARARDTGFPLRFERVDPKRVAVDEYGHAVTVDGKPVGTLDPGPVVLADGRVLESLIPMRWEGLGGLAREGSPIVHLATALLAAATLYAESPLPTTALTSTSAARLDDAEIDALLAAWDTARATRSTAYLEGVDLATVGWSARELQLVEAREHSALEVARAFSLPAYAVEASPSGTSMTYSNVVDRRRDLVEALRSWIAPLEQALSLHAAPRGTDIRFDVTAYLRDDPETRMRVWTSGLASGVLTLPEVRAAEPLATDQAPTEGGTP